MQFKLNIFIITSFFLCVSGDLVKEINYGGKVPSENEFDVYFVYDAPTGARDCEIMLKKKNGDIWINVAYTKTSCPQGNNKFVAATMKKGTIAVGAGYQLEVNILNGVIITAFMLVDVIVENGRQGFHVWQGKVYDANKNEFIMRGINNAHAWYDDYDRWWAYKALDNIALTKSNTVRIVWTKNGQLSVNDLDKVITRTIQLNMIPMVELHDATGSNDASKLYEMAQFWADNVRLLIKHRKYILCNIANEWSQFGTAESYWKDTYKQAVAIIRNAGFSGTLVLDASAYAQNARGPKLYGKELLNSEPYQNLIFSVHMYVEWSDRIPNFNIVNELQEIKTLGIPFIVGEFGNEHEARVNGGACEIIKIDAVGIMRECQKHGFGYLGWSWAGNGNGECGSLAYLDVTKDWFANNYSTWGNILVNSPGVGIKDTSKLATIF